MEKLAQEGSRALKEGTNYFLNVEEESRRKE
jgi:hypothetical protein